MSESFPAVCFLEDLSRILRVSRRTLDRRRRHGALPIRELPRIDKRPRWSGAEVQKFLEGQSELPVSWRKRRA
jgi:hypothetical protein